MNPGIFISYSRQDEKQAMHLLNVLRHEGYTVWIDQESIAGASIWSDEIVHNIKNSEIFIALLSESSVASSNVSKEIAIAAEHGKTILPVEIGTVVLPGRLEYALAGIQRTNYSDEQAILHAIKNQIARLSGESNEHALLPTKKQRQQKNRRRIGIAVGAAIIFAASLFFLLRRSDSNQDLGMKIAVLPFTTLNLEKDSTKNLDIFSDGIRTKISKLSAFTVVSSDITSAYKDSRFNAMVIGEELRSRFVIEGNVRKSHDMNIVSFRLYDIKRGGQIWENTYSGNTKELFVLLQMVCDDIQGHLAATETEERDIRDAEHQVELHPNDANAIATLGMRLIGTDKDRSLALFEKAVKLDSTNIAIFITGGVVAGRQNDLGRMHEFGRQALRLCRQQLPKHPDSLNLVTLYALALDMANETAAAERTFDSLMILYPTNVRILYNAACCYARQSKSDRCMDILEKLFPIAPGKRKEVQSDADFDNVRTNPRYEALVPRDAH